MELCKKLQVGKVINVTQRWDAMRSRASAGACENAVWLKTPDVMNQGLILCLVWAVYVHPLPKVGQDCCVKGRGSSALTYRTL